jgi:hypothetical protein
MNRVSKWLAICEGVHDECQQGHGKEQDLEFTLRVIDVEPGCIVEAAPNCRYIALSYVWGGVNQLQLSKTTYSALSRNDSITPSIIRVPHTIRDAIVFC